ncbi:MAG: serine acetyltransferase [Prevotella sp.]|nr:serine acetyltransferase [Candidatus Prevotella equi]
MNNVYNTINQVVDDLSSADSLKGLFHQVHDNVPLPSNDALNEIIQLARGILFPGYFGQSKVSQETIKYHVGVSLERFYRLLKKQVMAGLCFDINEQQPIEDVRAKAKEITEEIVRRLPEIRRILATDVEAAFNGDPAATSFGEIISCYPVIRTLTNYRLAHELHLLGVPLIPRMISELAHSETGIDIHPAAQIGHHFTIDHGTGVVIGATCIIGNNVKLYQGVTLGALSFPLDADGNPIKGIPRHPILGDDVIVYSNATVLGRITIGKGSVIGANEWVTTDVEPGGRKVRKKFRDEEYQ